jgi:hypothetical protein
MRDCAFAFTLSTLALVGATATMTNADFAQVKIGNRDPDRREVGRLYPMGERHLARDADYSDDGGLGLKADDSRRCDNNHRCALLTPTSRLNVMIAISAAAVPPVAVVKSDVASGVKLVAPPASDLACRESPIAVPTKPAMTQSRSAK